MDIPPASRWLNFKETGGDSATILWKLEEALEWESSFPTCLRMPSVSKDPEEITLAMRNGCAQVLRCLKVWYDLPSEVLYLATAHLDHFLSRMKVRPKHLSVIALSCFHLSSRQVAFSSGEHSEFLHAGCQTGTPITIPDPRDLLAISQCRCSLGDLSRMETIVVEKLSLYSSQSKRTVIASSNGGTNKQEWSPNSFSPNESIVPNGKTFSSTRVLPREYSLQSAVQHFSIVGRQHGTNLETPFPHHSLLPYPVTPMCFLYLIHSFVITSARSKMSSKSSESSKWTNGEFNECLSQVSPARLQHHLEAIACDGSLSCFRPSEVALSLMCVMLDQMLGSVTCLSSPSPAYKAGRQAQSSWLCSSVLEIKKFCKIPDATFARCHSAVLTVVRCYESRCDASRWYGSDGSNCTGDYEDELSLDEEDDDDRGMRSWRRNGRKKSRGAYVEGWGPLAWRVSQRTLRNLRPTEKLVSWPPMPTIHETSLSCRIRSCSLSSEESSDPGEEEEEYEEGSERKSPERGNEWRPLPTPMPQLAWASMNPLLEEEGGEE